MKKRVAVVCLMRAFLIGACGCFAALAQSNDSHSTIAHTPPMGWNSWQSWGESINEPDVRATATWMHDHLQRYGWNYMVIDEGWYTEHPEADAPGYVLSSHGEYLPAPDRYPSSTGDRGFKPLAAWLHQQGLKLGIHIIRGIPREAVEKNLPIAGSSFHARDAANPKDQCSWNDYNYGLKNNQAAQSYYNSIAKLYASWGVDLIKVDCISAPYNQSEIDMISSAIRQSGRPMVISLSPGPTPLAQADHVREHSNMWRISDDFWDVWSTPDSAPSFPQSVVRQMKLLAEWEPYAGPGHWPDADILPIGYLGPRPGWGEPHPSKLTWDEQKAMMTLWVIARSPLMIGGNLTRMDAASESLLTNPEVLAVNQHSGENRQRMRTADSVVWTAKRANAKSTYVAVVNLSDHDRTFQLTWNDLGIDPGTHRVRDLWARKDGGKADAFSVSLNGHAAALYEIDAPVRHENSPDLPNHGNTASR